MHERPESGVVQIIYVRCPFVSVTRGNANDTRTLTVRLAPCEIVTNLFLSRVEYDTPIK